MGQGLAHLLLAVVVRALSAGKLHLQHVKLWSAAHLRVFLFELRPLSFDFLKGLLLQQHL